MTTRSCHAARAMSLAGCLSLAAAVLPALPASVYAAAQCGGEGERPCTVAPAKFAGRKPAQCPSGAFFDPIDGGSCWRCPSGAKRTVFHVKSPDACEQPAHQKFSGATRHGRGTGLVKTDCPRGQFWDPNGFCWSCPGGYGRTAHPVTSGNACAATVRAARSHAQAAGSLACPQGSFFDLVDGGTCWSCPQGYSRTASHVKAGDACATTLLAGVGTAFGTCDAGHTNLGGACSRIGNCGASGQRPCLLGERTPSCNANLKENFKRNVCEPLRPGESPFLAGVASFAEFYGDTLRAVCRQGLGGINIPSGTELAMGANCSKNVMAGAACEWMVEQAGGSVAGGAHALLSAGPQAVQFKQHVDQAYASRPCSQFAEKTAPAQRFGRGSGAIGTDCAAGQFWDPNGWCYACPKGYTRTLNAVDTPAACVDKFGGEVIRSSCSVFAAADRTFGQSAKCAVEVMESGAFLSKPLDFQSASQEYCMATGEFTYAVFDLVAAVQKTPQQKADKLDTSLQRLVAAIKRETAQARRYGDLAIRTASVAGEGKNTIDRLNDLAHCRR
jgi:hypothetical protein